MIEQQVWKFPLPIVDRPFVMMPEGARVLSVGEQAGVGLCVWALVEPDAPPKARLFRVAGTGHPIYPSPEDGVGAFVGTALTDNGRLVWHVWEHEQEPTDGASR